MTTVLILAAGKSSRMKGMDKLMQSVDGHPLLRRQIERAQRHGPVYVALPSPEHPRLAALEGTGAIALVVPEASEGMGGTLRGAVPQLPDGDFVLLLGDLVDIRGSDLRAVIDAKAAHPKSLIWRGATTDGKPGHPIMFDKSLRSEFDKLHGDSGGESLVNPLLDQTHMVLFDDDRARRDLDTPEDWQQWRSDQASRSNNSAS